MAGRPGQRAARQRRARRNARLVGLAGFLGAIALPIALWHRAIALLAADFRLNLHYLLTGWLGYGLILIGLLLSLPVLLSIGREPEDRFYPRARNAYFGWAVSCYLLGLALAVQVAAIAGGLADH